MIRSAAVAVLLTASTALTACSGADSTGGAGGTDGPAGSASSSAPADPTKPSTSPSISPSAPAAPEVGPQYVALGDSYAAAPGVPVTSGADGCFRSSGNYAQLVARATGLTVTDVTCSGADTTTALRDQVPAITPEAELVTVGIGGNDFDLFGRLISSCVQLAGSDPTGSPCSDAIRAEAEQTLPRIDDNVGTLLEAVVEAAPRARVVVVGYPALLPESGSCPDLVPLAPGDYPLLNEVTRGLSEALRTQAERLDLDFVDLTGPSRGHDICSDEPWVNGQRVADDGTIPFHPFAVQQQAVARRVVAFL